MREGLKVFISRAGQDVAVSGLIERALTGAGFVVFSQDTTFGNANFMVRMHDALREADRIVALLSESYLKSDYCLAEWANALAEDPLNRKGRLVVLRIEDISPVGIIGGIPYRDIAKMLDDPDALSLTLAGILSSASGAQPQVPEAFPPSSGSMGTVLLGEIEDSTERWSLQPASMRADVERLSALLHDSCAGGGEAFMVSPNAFAASFPNPTRAFSVAVELQRRLEEPADGESRRIALKLAIHTGNVERVGKTIVGEAVARATRLLARADGGVILASAAAAGVTRGNLPEGIDVVDLGAYKLDAQEQEERIYQVSFDGARRARIREGYSTNVTARPTSLVGRAQDVAEVANLLLSDRIVTLLGFGGVGKTRIALETATRTLDAYPDGVWFVQLAPVADADLIVDTIAAALGMRSDGSVTSLAAALRSRRTLLILDNCEHLVAPAGAVAVQLRADCPDLAILATSRQPLGVEGERLYRVEPLQAPPESRQFSPEEAMSYDAVQLFVERARSVDRRFTLRRENVAAVAAVCLRLEGVPLAIELAAARINTLGVDDLLARLGDRFKLLKRSSGKSAARHQTLRATIDWSYELLAPSEKELFARLAVFAGGWSLDAAEYVCEDEEAEIVVLDDLFSLVDKSLVTFDSTGEHSRYAFLETTHEYAREKLASGGAAGAIASRRAEWFASFSDDAYQRFRTTPQPQWMARVLPEMENLRASVHWAIEHGDPETAGRIAGGLTPLWQARGVGEGRRYVEHTLEHWTDGRPSKIEALLWLTLAATTVAKQKAEAAESAGRIYSHLADRVGEAESLRYRAEGLRQMQHLDGARDALAQALALFSELKLLDSPSYSALLQTRALILANEGRYAESVGVFDEAMQRFAAAGDEPSTAGAKCQLAEVYFWAGDVDRALELGGEAIELCRKLGDTVKEAAMTVNVAAYHLLAGDAEPARAAAREALELASALDIGFYVTLALQHLGTVAALNGDAVRGTLLLSYVDRWLSREGFERETTEQRTYDLGREALRGRGAVSSSTATPEITEDEALTAARQV